MDQALATLPQGLLGRVFSGSMLEMKVKISAFWCQLHQHVSVPEGGSMMSEVRVI